MASSVPYDPYIPSSSAQTATEQSQQNTGGNQKTAAIQAVS